MLIGEPPQSTKCATLRRGALRAPVCRDGGGWWFGEPPQTTHADFTARRAICASRGRFVAQIGPRAVVSRGRARRDVRISPHEGQSVPAANGSWHESAHMRWFRGIPPNRQNKKPPRGGGFGGACCTRRDYMNWLVSFSMVPSAFSFARASLMAAVRAVLSLLTTMAYSSPVAMDLTTLASL